MAPPPRWTPPPRCAPPPPNERPNAEASEDDSAKAPSETVAATASMMDLRNILNSPECRAWGSGGCFIHPLVVGPRTPVHAEISMACSRLDPECPFTPSAVNPKFARFLGGYGCELRVH